MSRDAVLWVMLAAALATPLALRLWVAGTLPLVEPTEGRYAQIAAEMADSGDWVTPRVWIDDHKIPFLGKPPLYMWSAAFSIWLLGATELAVRLPSLIATAALLVLMLVVVGRYVDRSTAIAAVLIASTSLLVYGTTATVIYDLHLSFFVVGALLAQLAFTLEEDPSVRGRWSLAVFALLGGGFLTKGPVALVLFGLPVLVWTSLTRSWRALGRHRWAAGLALFTLITVPWFVLAELRNPGFSRYFFINENLLRYLVPDYGDLYGSGHRYPRGSAVVMFLASALPWSAVAVWWIVRRGLAGIRRLARDRVTLFFLLGFLCQVAFWCFARQLLPTYMLPALPLFAIWLAGLMVRDSKSLSRLVVIAVVAANLWSMTMIVAEPIASRRTARAVLASAHQMADRAGVKDRIIFAGRTPHSAGFYFDRKVDRHPGESAEATIERTLASGEPCLLVVCERDLDAVPGDRRSLLQPLTLDGSWQAMVVGPAAPDHHHLLDPTSGVARLPAISAAERAWTDRSGPGGVATVPHVTRTWRRGTIGRDDAAHRERRGGAAGSASVRLIGGVKQGDQ